MVNDVKYPIYQGYRDAEFRPHVSVLYEDGRREPLPPLDNQVPFGWGHSGLPASNLALAILTHHMGDAGRAVRIYELFRDSVVRHFSVG